MTTDRNEVLIQLLNNYERVMCLKIFVDNADQNLKDTYINKANIHNHLLQNCDHIDAGFDLYYPNEDSVEIVKKIDFNICCSAKIITDSGKIFNTGYYMYPRSSLSKTPLRLANSVGIIDAGYRGHLIGMFDIVSTANLDFTSSKYDRYVQICAPSLVPMFVEIVSSKEELGEETERGEGGFGSTGH
jgi:dUTP pyrophosphatase